MQQQKCSVSIENPYYFADVSGPGIGKSKSCQMWKLKFGKHSIFGNFKVLSVLANPITRCLMNAQHSISDSLMMLPKLAIAKTFSVFL